MRFMDTDAGRAATSRRYSAEQKQQAVRMVFALRAELGTSAGTITRVNQSAECGAMNRPENNHSHAPLDKGGQALSVVASELSVDVGG